MNFYEQLTRHFRSTDRDVLVTSAGDRWPLSRLEHCAALFFETLVAHGLNSGDRVLVQVSKTPECIALYLCCLHSGFVYVPLNTAYTEDELGYYLDDAEPSVLVLDDASENNRGIDIPVLSMSSFDDVMLSCELSQREHEITDAYYKQGFPGASDLACIIYTSGTTGRPKGAALTHSNLLSNGRCLSKAWGFCFGDVLLHALPVYHVHGLFIALHSALLGGAEIRFLIRFDVNEIIDVLPVCTVMMGVPTYYSRLLASSQFTRAHCTNVRVFISGSAPLSIELFKAFEERSGHVILERYGMSETNIISSNPLNGERVSGTVGFALEGNEVRVADTDDQGLPSGRTGGVQVRGDGVFKGYWRRPEVTAQEFTKDGFFRTGDLGELDAEGRLTLKGRSKDLIISGGLNVYPAEIERVLDGMSGVRESAVVGVPDPDFGERVEAFIVSDGSTENLTEILKDAVRLELANFKRPKAYHLIESLPRNTMGKVQKTVLRERLASAREGSQTSAS